MVKLNNRWIANHYPLLFIVDAVMFALIGLLLMHLNILNSKSAGIWAAAGVLLVGSAMVAEIVHTGNGK